MTSQLRNAIGTCLVGLVFLLVGLGLEVPVIWAVGGLALVAGLLSAAFDVVRGGKASG